MSTNKTFIAETIELVDHHTLVPADYNPRQMDGRTLRVLVRSLVRFGWVLPVVANRRTNRIVGGHQRARANAHIVKTGSARRKKDYSRVPVIYVDLPEREEKALNVALNQISGDWDFYKRAAADELRQNATFAQMTRKSHAFGNGYRSPLGLKRLDFKNPEHHGLFVETFGNRILDFGCGRGQEVDWLTKAGIRAVGFEPFRRVKGKNRLDIQITRCQVDALLAELRVGFQPDTVFCNFVISSMASPTERGRVLTILQALAGHGATVVISVRSTFDACYQQVLGRVRASKNGYLGIPDTSEPGLVVTGAGTDKQKFQKFYERAEFLRLVKRRFTDCNLAEFTVRDKAFVAVCRNPKPLAQAALDRALLFEFNLPINGERIDRHVDAIAVFKKWSKRRK